MNKRELDGWRWLYQRGYERGLQEREMADRYALVPVEPTSEMLEALYGPFLSVSAHSSRIAAYKEMLSAATLDTANQLPVVASDDMDRYDVCPVCSGDCSAANPPVTNCPMEGRTMMRVEKEYTDQQLREGVKALRLLRSKQLSDETICGGVYDVMLSAGREGVERK